MHIWCIKGWLKYVVPANPPWRTVKSSQHCLRLSTQRRGSSISISSIAELKASTDCRHECCHDIPPADRMRQLVSCVLILNIKLLVEPATELYLCCASAVMASAREKPFSVNSRIESSFQECLQ